MKRNTCALTLLAAVLAVPVLPATARAEISHFRGETASLNSYSYDATGCISTSVYVFATESREHSQPGSSTSGASASFSLYQYNECTGVELACVSGAVALPNGAFDVSGNLASATLNTTIEAYDYCNDTTSPVDIALTWTGDGQVFQGRVHQTFHYPDYRQTFRSQGKSSNATVSGSVTFEGTSVPLENGYAYLSNVNSGTIFKSN
jgi:hypothetical protein